MTRRSHRLLLTALTAGTLCAFPLTSVPAGATTTTPAADAGQGDSPKVSKVAGDTQVSYFVGLARDDAAAAKEAAAVNDPTSAQYRQFPDRSTIQQKYGASAETLSKLTAVLKDHNLTMELDGTGVFATVTGAAKDFDRLIGIPTVKTTEPLPQAGTASVMTIAAKGSAESEGLAALQRKLKGVVTEFIPLDATYSYSPLQLSGVVPVGYQTQPEVDENKGTPAGCLTTDHPELSEQIYSFNEITTAYGLPELAAQPELGQSVRMAIVALGDGFAEESLTTSQDCFGLPPVEPQRVAIPGLDSPLPEGNEGDLDVQVAQAVLPPGSSLTVVESPGMDPLMFLAFSTLFNLPEPVDVASSSYGSCEASLQGEQGVAVAESVLLRLALSGTSVFSAAGDTGSSDCESQAQQDKKLSVDYPGSSPWVTSVGGTRLTVTPDNTRADEVVWNDKELPADESLKQQAGAGGGGMSILYKAPEWQNGADTKTEQRAVPDLAAHASQVPAWPLVFGGTFTPVGGTSAATPLVTSGFAMIAAKERAAGNPPLGAVQPWLYQEHKQNPEAFFDIVKGSNDLFDQGCCTARPGYDEASGLGAPVFPQLANSLTAPGGAS